MDSEGKELIQSSTISNRLLRVSPSTSSSCRLAAIVRFRSWIRWAMDRGAFLSRSPPDFSKSSVSVAYKHKTQNSIIHGQLFQQFNINSTDDMEQTTNLPVKPDRRCHWCLWSRRSCCLRRTCVSEASWAKAAAAGGFLVWVMRSGSISSEEGM